MTMTHDERMKYAAGLKERVDATRNRLARKDHTVEEIAALLGVHRGSIYAAIKVGALGHYRVGRKIRITQAHLDAFRAGTLAGE